MLEEEAWYRYNVTTLVYSLSLSLMYILNSTD